MICMGVRNMGMIWPCMAMQRWEETEYMAWCRERKCSGEKKWVSWVLENEDIGGGGYEESDHALYRLRG